MRLRIATALSECLKKDFNASNSISERRRDPRFISELISFTFKDVPHQGFETRAEITCILPLHRCSGSSACTMNLFTSRSPFKPNYIKSGLRI